MAIQIRKSSDPCETVQQFLDRIERIKTADDEVTVYRGHSDEKFLMQPAVFREKRFKDNEHLLQSELIAAQPNEFSTDLSALERLVRMQHYDLPTRLLDATWNPLVALYFASQSNKERHLIEEGPPKRYRSIENTGEVICLTIKKSNVKYFDSDTVSCLANISRLDPTQKDVLRSFGFNAAFNLETVGKRLVHFISSEKPGFLAEIDPNHLYGVYLVKPKQSNRRILAQSGAFFVFGLTEAINETGTALIKVNRIKISANKKSTLRQKLDHLAIHERSMFPELDRSAAHIKSSLKASKAARTII